MLTDAGTVLGPATVTEIAGDRVRVERADGSAAWAQLALAQPYEPEPGDVVLAIGADEVYVIGVLTGRGRTVLRAPGRLELRAESVAIVGERELELSAPQVTVRGDRVETFARDVFERVVNAYRFVKEALQLNAGRVREQVDGHATRHAERVVMTADKDVRLDGEKIRLG